MASVLLVLLIFGHWALDQWPPWPSALIPYSSWSHAPAWPPHSQHASATGHLCLRLGFFPLQVETQTVTRVQTRWLRWSLALDSSTESCFLDTAAVIIMCWMNLWQWHHQAGKKACLRFWTQSVHLLTYSWKKDQSHNSCKNMCSNKKKCDMVEFIILHHSAGFLKIFLYCQFVKSVFHSVFLCLLQHDGRPYCHKPCYAALFGPKGVVHVILFNTNYLKFSFLNSILKCSFQAIQTLE